MTQIIAFAHRRRVGKDTCCDFLNTYIRCGAPQLRIRKISFASKLKDISHQLFAWAGLREAVFYDNYPEKRETILPELGMTPREIWITTGNKMRDVFTAVWIENALRGTPGLDIILISDLRFENEVDAVHRLGGIVYKIIRKDVPLSDDASDSALDYYKGFDGEINNDGTLADLGQKMEVLAEALIRG